MGNSEGRPIGGLRRRLGELKQEASEAARPCGILISASGFSVGAAEAARGTTLMLWSVDDRANLQTAASTATSLNEHPAPPKRFSSVGAR